MNAELTTRILAIVLALFLWTYVRISLNTPETHRTITGVPVRVLTAPGYSWQLRPGDNTVDVYIKGPADVVNNILREDITATADARRLEAARAKRVPVRITLPRGADFAGRLPTVNVKIIPLERKAFPVTIVFTAVPPAGTMLGDYILDPTMVNVEGSREALAQVNQVMVRLDPADALKAEREFIPRAVNAEGERVPGVLVLASTVRVSMASLTGTHLSRQVAVRPPELLNMPKGRTVSIVEVSPDVVTISGAPATLDALQGYLACASLDVHDVEQDTTRTVRVDVPEGLTITGPKTVRVNLTVSDTR